MRDKEAVSILFDDIAPRFEERQGGYTRIMRLAKPRLGDAGTRAILEFVGQNDRVKVREAERPAFEDDAVDEAQMESAPVDEPEEESTVETEASGEPAADENGPENGGDSEETKE